MNSIDIFKVAYQLLMYWRLLARLPRTTRNSGQRAKHWGSHFRNSPRGSCQAGNEPILASIFLGVSPPFHCLFIPFLTIHLDFPCRMGTLPVCPSVWPHVHTRVIASPGDTQWEVCSLMGFSFGEMGGENLVSGQSTSHLLNPDAGFKRAGIWLSWTLCAACSCCTAVRIHVDAPQEGPACSIKALILVRC